MIEPGQKLCIIIRIRTGQVFRQEDRTEIMEKLFYENPYLKSFTARVVSCVPVKKGFETELDRTAFYPEGGGQPSDTGVLGGVRVLDVQEKNGRILHITDQALTEGAEVQGEINWEERFSNMQLHSGEHIVSGLIHKAFGYDNVGFHMGAEEMTIDLNGPMTWDQLMEIERQANQAVWDNMPLHIFYPPEEELSELDYRSKKELTGQVRIVEIPGTDLCACCGTHVAYTGEIGLIKFLSMINYKGGVRISMLCGKRALLACERRVEQAAEISALLSAKVEEIVEAVKRQKEELAEEKAAGIALTRQLMNLKSDCYPDSEGILAVFEESFSPVQVRQFCNLLMEKGKGAVTVVFGGGKDGYSYAAASKTHDMKEFSQKLNRSLNGRGGGSAQMVQGSVKTSREEVEAWFLEAAETGEQKIER